MPLNFEKGKATELESLTGFIVHESEKLGLETPVIRDLYAQLKKGLKPQYKMLLWLIFSKKHQS